MKKGGKDVRATVFEFLRAGSREQMLSYAARHPALFEPEADEILASLARQVAAEGNAGLASKLTECRQMLAALRDQASVIPVELQPLFAKIRGLGADDFAERAALLRQLVPLIDPATHRGFWVSARSMLGSALGDLAERDGSFDFREAVAALLATLPVLAGMPDEARVLATNHHNLGMFLSRQRPVADTESAIGHFSAAVGSDQLAAGLRVEALVQLAGLLLDRTGAGRAQDIDRAITCAGEALALTNSGETVERRVAALRLLGSAYTLRLAGTRRDNLAKAIGYLHEAESAVDRDASPGEWFAVQASLGSAYREGAITPADEAMERAIRHFRAAAEVAAGHLDDRDLATALNGLGTAYAGRVRGVFTDNVTQAIGYYGQAMAILRAPEMGYERELVARNLATAYLKRDSGAVDANIASAVELLRKAADHFSGHGMPYDHAATLMMLGQAYLGWQEGGRAGNIDRAIDAVTEAAEIFDRIGAPREVATCRLTLANVYLRSAGANPSRVEAAVNALKSARTEFEKQSMPVEQAGTEDALGQAWMRREDRDVDEAIGYHEAALRTLGSSSVSPQMWGIVQSNLGAAYVERGGQGPRRARDLELACAHLEESLAVGAAGRIGLAGGLVMTRINLGIAYTERAGYDRPDDLATAITHLEAGFEAVTAAGEPLQRQIGGKALADAYARTGRRWADAVRAYREALAAADDLYVSALLRSDREAELAQSSDLHRSAAHAAAMAGDPGQAAVWLERGRARGLGDSLARDVAQLDLVGGGHEPLAAEFKAAARGVQEIEIEEWGAPVIPGVDVAGEPVRRHRTREARRRLNDAIEAIRALPEHGTFLRQPELADITSVAATAGPLAYVAAIRTGCLVVLVAATDSVTVRVLDGPLTSESLRAMLIPDSHGGYLREMVEGGFAGLAHALDELLPVLGEQLMRPLAEAVSEAGARRVTIVAYGLLGLLPLHAAGYERDGLARTLLDDVEVGYAPSARVLDAAQSRRRDLDRLLRTPVLAGVGNPAGAGLRYAAYETEAISRLFDLPRTFFDDEATEANLVASAPGATHVHLACHGDFDPNHPLESPLFLAGTDRLTLRGILTGRPFVDARLAVASACRTAVSDFMHLPDEVLGLPAGLLQAGTPGVVGTLWTVDDLSTALLMIRFYEYLFGAGEPESGRPAAALRAAQRWLAGLTTAELDRFVDLHRQRDAVAAGPAIRDADSLDFGAPALPGPDDRPFSHPYYWAPFVFIGA